MESSALSVQCGPASFKGAATTGSKLDGGEVREDEGAAFVLRHRVCTSSDTTDPTHTSTSDGQDTMSASADHRSDGPAHNRVSAEPQRPLLFTNEKLVSFYQT